MLRTLILTCCLTAAPAFAEDAVLSIAQDRYQAGPSVRFAGPAVSDLYMAGNKVVVAAPVAGSAHLAGRRLCPDRWGRCKTMPGMAGPGHCLSKCRSGGLSQVS